MLHPWQRRVVATAWVTYAAYYLGRLNFSVALPDIQTTLGFSKSALGIISTGFFWVYAVGQLVNGYLGDRFSPRRFVLVGMLASAASTFAFGVSSAYGWLLALWMANGYFQSTGWGPILRTLANWLTPEQRTRISGIFGTSFVAGSMLTLLAGGWLADRFGWRAAFWLPALLLAVVAAGWYMLIRDMPEQNGHDRTHVAAVSEAPVLGSMLAGVRRAWLLMAAAVCSGFAVFSLAIWVPTYYVEVWQLEIGQAATLSTLIPLAGIGGTLLLGWYVGHRLVGREAAGLAVALGVLAALFLVLVVWPAGLAFSSFTLTLIGAFAYGTSSLLLITMTLLLTGRTETSSMAGLVDFTFNLGAALSGVVVGAILDSQSWRAVFIVLAGASFGAAAFIGILARLNASARTVRARGAY